MQSSRHPRFAPRERFPHTQQHNRQLANQAARDTVTSRSTELARSQRRPRAVVIRMQAYTLCAIAATTNIQVEHIHFYIIHTNNSTTYFMIHRQSTLARHAAPMLTDAECFFFFGQYHTIYAPRDTTTPRTSHVF